MKGTQTPLPLIEKRAYKPETFFVHSGVAEIVLHADKTLASKVPGITLITGDKFKGKSHLGIYLTAAAVKLGGFAVYLNFNEALTVIKEKKYEVINKATSILIDDFDKLALNFPSENSGPVVSFCEHCKNNNIHLFFILSKSIDELPCDLHIISRLKGARFFEILDPADQDLEKLLISIAKQRGLKLGKKGEEFVIKRLPRTVKSLNEYLDRLTSLNKFAVGKMGFGRVKEVI